jgi:hypothetical protein
MFAAAAAQAIGLAVKLEEWKNIAARSSEQCASKMRAVESVAASGMLPPVSPLAVQRISGVIPACSQANKRAGAAPAGHHLVGDEQNITAQHISAPCYAVHPQNRRASRPRRE